MKDCILRRVSYRDGAQAALKPRNGAPHVGLIQREKNDFAGELTLAGARRQRRWCGGWVNDLQNGQIMTEPSCIRAGAGCRSDRLTRDAARL